MSIDVVDSLSCWWPDVGGHVSVLDVSLVMWVFLFLEMTRVCNRIHASVKRNAWEAAPTTTLSGVHRVLFFLIFDRLHDGGVVAMLA